MDQQVYNRGKLKIYAGVKKLRFKTIYSVPILKPETMWSNHEQVEFIVETLFGGPNPCLLKNTGTICD